MISSCTHPNPNTPPPRYLFAKSACARRNHKSSSVRCAPNPSCERGDCDGQHVRQGRNEPNENSGFQSEPPTVQSPGIDVLPHPPWLALVISLVLHVYVHNTSMPLRYTSIIYLQLKAMTLFAYMPSPIQVQPLVVHIPEKPRLRRYRLCHTHIARQDALIGTGGMETAPLESMLYV